MQRAMEKFSNNVHSLEVYKKAKEEQIEQLKDVIEHLLHTITPATDDIALMWRQDSQGNLRQQSFYLVGEGFVSPHPSIMPELVHELSQSTDPALTPYTFSLTNIDDMAHVTVTAR